MPRPALVAALTAVLAATGCLPERDRTVMPPVETTADAPASGVRGTRVGSALAPTPAWTGRTLGGGEVTITVDDAPPGVTFVGDLPSVVAHIDKLARAGDCDGLADQRAWFRLQAGTDPAHGDAASAFAHHADAVARFIGCAGVDGGDEG